ncbi:MAG: efflux RND transporter periplasmic adaptor subunit [Candidatus Acidiferrales bacterium]
MRDKFGGLILAATVWLTLGLPLVGCNRSKSDLGAEAPPPAQVEREQDANFFEVDHPERFPLVAAIQHDAASELSVTGTVNPDIAKTVPVISLATGRVVEIQARLGDVVKKGQLLLRVRSSDVSGAYQVYLKAENDERLARLQFERTQILYERGATAKSALETAEDTEQDAKVALDTATEQLQLLGVDKDHPSGIVDITAPVSGVITDQQVTNAAGVQGLSGPNPFTISDLSTVWVVCDVYENDLPQVHLGDIADIHLNAYPNLVLKGKVNNVGSILDPALRTAKVRVEVQNPGVLRVGMFATAKFYGSKKEPHAAVPASAVLHLHDRDWVYAPAGEKKFRRIEVRAGVMLPDNMQEIISGIRPGQQIVKNALELQNTVDQ